MASLRRYDVQGKIALDHFVRALVGVAALGYLVFGRNFKSDLRMIVYSSKSIFAPTVFLTTAVTFLLGGIGAALGVNSAGQRRNEHSKRSWAAFFIGAACISLTIVFFAAFWLYRMALA